MDGAELPSHIRLKEGPSDGNILNGTATPGIPSLFAKDLQGVSVHSTKFFDNPFQLRLATCLSASGIYL